MEAIKLWLFRLFTRKIEEHNRLKLGDVLYKPVYSTDPTRQDENYEKIGVVTELRIYNNEPQKGNLLVTIER